jgi:hypothetical protein
VSVKIPPTKEELWVSGDHIAVVVGLLKATAEQYHLVLWFNGVKLHDPGEEVIRETESASGTERG